MIERPHVCVRRGVLGVAAFGVCLLAELLRATGRAALAAAPRLGGSHHLTGLIPGVVPGNAGRVPGDGQASLHRDPLLGLLMSIFHFLTSFPLGLIFSVNTASLPYGCQIQHRSYAGLRTPGRKSSAEASGAHGTCTQTGSAGHCCPIRPAWDTRLRR